MRTAFAVWNKRIAPVFDVARQVRIVETSGRRIVGEVEEALTTDGPAQRASHLATLGVDSLVCGAISRPLEGLIASYGVNVVSFVTGGLRDVVRAWLSGTLSNEIFAMPGCGRRRGRRSRRRAGGGCGR